MREKDGCSKKEKLKKIINGFPVSD